MSISTSAPPDYLKSEACQHELQRALAGDKKIVPIIAAPLQRNQKLPPEIKQKLYINLSGESDRDSD